MLVRLRNIRNSSIYVDNAFFASLNNRRMVGEINLIVFSIPQDLISSAERMYEKAVKIEIFSIIYYVEHFRCFCRSQVKKMIPLGLTFYNKHLASIFICLIFLPSAISESVKLFETG